MWPLPEMSALFHRERGTREGELTELWHRQPPAEPLWSWSAPPAPRPRYGQILESAKRSGGPGMMAAGGPYLYGQSVGLMELFSIRGVSVYSTHMGLKEDDLVPCLVLGLDRDSGRLWLFFFLDDTTADWAFTAIFRVDAHPSPRSRPPVFYGTLGSVSRSSRMLYEALATKGNMGHHKNQLDQRASSPQ